MSGREGLGYYLMGVNVLAFLLMGLDKRRAELRRQRISENMLFLLPLLGGSLGGIAGMGMFRHKTLHRRFAWGLPALLVIQAALIYHFLKG